MKLLVDYDIDEVHGFLLPDPLTKLPEPFQRWVEIAENITTLVESKQLRDEVDKLPLFDYKKLTTHKEQRLARVALSYIAGSYVWQGGDAHAIKVLPKNIAVPFWNLSQELNLAPIALNADCVLANWTKINPDGPLELSNLRSLVQLPGGQSSAMFFLLPVQTELEAVPGLKAIAAALSDKDPDSLKGQLDTMTSSIKRMQDVIAQLHVHIDADVFYNVVRPYLFGFGVPGTTLADGLIFEGVSDEPIKAVGASAAQTSPIQCFDAALGIKHEQGKREFLLMMRTYMPSKHKQFIDDIETATPSIRSRAEGHRDPAVLEAYNMAVNTLTKFRSYHIQIVAKYVTVPAGKVNRAREIGGQPPNTGTGGQSIMPFLKGLRDETKEHVIEGAPVKNA